MGKEFKDKVFKGLIWSFLVLYVIVGFVSFYHCIEFCAVGNPMFLSVLMSFAFEVGLALTLFSILITDENKNNIVSWILMTLLTCVQVMGNIFSVEKYMELSQNNFYIYIQNGFLHWFTEDMPQQDVMSIIAILLGALLPFVALLMTSMVARNWKNKVKEDEELKKLDLENEKQIQPTVSPEENVEDEVPVLEEQEKEVVQYSAPTPVLEERNEGEETSALDKLVDRAKNLAKKENENEIIDVRPEMTGPTKPVISLFNPINR